MFTLLKIFTIDPSLHFILISESVTTEDERLWRRKSMLNLWGICSRKVNYRSCNQGSDWWRAYCKSKYAYSDHTMDKNIWWGWNTLIMIKYFVRSTHKRNTSCFWFLVDLLTYVMRQFLKKSNDQSAHDRKKSIEKITCIVKKKSKLRKTID